MDIKDIQMEIDKLDNKGEIHDGSHSFNELYYHRMKLFAFIVNTNKNKSWKSKLHHDNTMFDDYFIVGIDTPEGMYTYHYELKHWDEFKCIEIERAPEYDGHKPSDITRLESIGVCSGPR